MNDFLQTQGQGAVSGAAAMALKLSDDAEERDWGRSVLQRALGTPLDDGPMMSEVAEVMFHPVVNAAAGFTAAMERGLAREQERQAVLRLALHPLLKVKKALYKGLARCWEREPHLCWQAFALGMRLSVEPRSVLYDEPRTIGLKRSAAETLGWTEISKRSEPTCAQVGNLRFPPFLRHGLNLLDLVALRLQFLASRDRTTFRGRMAPRLSLRHSRRAPCLQPARARRRC